jgi:hypothetical protein
MEQQSARHDCSAWRWKKLRTLMLSDDLLTVVLPVRSSWVTSHVVRPSCISLGAVRRRRGRWEWRFGLEEARFRLLALVLGTWRKLLAGEAGSGRLLAGVQGLEVPQGTGS